MKPEKVFKFCVNTTLVKWQDIIVISSIDIAIIINNFGSLEESQTPN